ncbi:MAG: hypothetical protein J3K34DRAFT_475414 [Monoraphidium minutum]|nr:MAG: hypothetical protein J3K34DRAFT_475414 [Monoraphidium minutum]
MGGPAGAEGQGNTQQQLWGMQLPWNRKQQQQQQQQQQAAPEARAAARHLAPPPLAAASLSRLLLTSTQNGTPYVRNALSGRRSSTSGPLSLLLFLLTLVAALLAAVRGAAIKKSRACRDCRGFGVCRCSLCGGEGRVAWAAKLSHSAACPLCMNRRFVACGGCGGMFKRPIFAHARQPTQGEWDEVYGAFTGAGASGGEDAPVSSTRND